VTSTRMTTTHSADVLTSDEDDNQNPSPQEYSHDRTESSPKPSTPPGSAGSSHPEKSSRPVQKRRRITRACDECRKKKIKCDGKQPCTHCTVYSYECTYDQPSNRRRNPAPAYIEALESRLQKTEAILRTVLPEVNLDDPKFDAHTIDQIVDSSKHARISGNRSGKEPGPSAVQDDDAQLKTMVEGTGSLELDDQGHWDYHGTSSGFTFIRNLRAQFGDLAVPDPRIPHSKSRAMSHLIDSPKSVSSSPYDLSTPPAADLPDKDRTMQLCRNTLEVACALMRFVHKPRFYGNVVKIIGTDPEHYTNADTQFLPLLYVVMAVGCLFAQTENTMLDTDGYESAMAEGYSDHLSPITKNVC
jgi:Fungal Zn(2)-Cys(6) binuclear cluster domain